LDNITRLLYYQLVVQEAPWADRRARKTAVGIYKSLAWFWFVYSTVLRSGGTSTTKRRSEL